MFYLTNAAPPSGTGSNYYVALKDSSLIAANKFLGALTLLDAQMEVDDAAAVLTLDNITINTLSVGTLHVIGSIVYDGDSPVFAYLNFNQLNGSPTTHTGAGALDASATSIIDIVTTGAQALTLANGGTPGQLLFLTMITDGGDGTLTPATKTGFSTLTFDDVGDSAILMWHTTKGWMLLGTPSATKA